VFFNKDRKKEIVMVNVISVEDMVKINMGVGRGGVSKYPWDTIPVDGGFSVPLSDMKKTDNRPSPPTRLVQSGVKFISRKTSVDGVPSIVLQRIA